MEQEVALGQVRAQALGQVLLFRLQLHASGGENFPILPLTRKIQCRCFEACEKYSWHQSKPPSEISRAASYLVFFFHLLILALLPPGVGVVVAAVPRPSGDEQLTQFTSTGEISKGDFKGHQKEYF